METQICLPKILFYVISNIHKQKSIYNYNFNSPNKYLLYVNRLRLVNRQFSLLIPSNFLRIKCMFIINNGQIKYATTILLKQLYSTYKLDGNSFYIEGYGPMGVQGAQGSIGTCTGFSGASYSTNTSKDYNRKANKIERINMRRYYKQQNKIFFRRTINNHKRR